LKGIQFEFGAFALDSADLKIVGELSEKMKLYPATVIEITGHTDPTEPEPTLLGLQRAQAISDELKRLGVSSDRVKALSRGSDNPLANNQSARGRSKNRRVELEPK
jgi:outer membrane protein OmpA-like peptidoglycan-associated protein